MKDVLVTIIVPIYNVADYLDKCIESILQQTYKNIEVILVDDGSTDKSSDICDCYKEKDTRIVVIHKKNEGLVSARKAGLNVARGRYILNIDGDDRIASDMCEVLLKRALETDADVVDSGYYEIRSNGRKEYKCENGCFDLQTNGTAIDLLECWLKNPVNRRVHSTLVSKLYNKQVFEQIYAEITTEQSYGEDILSFLEMLKKVNTIAVVDKCFYYYAVRDNSLSHKLDFGRFLKYNELDTCVYRKTLELFPNVNTDILNDWYIERKRNIVNIYAPECLIQRNVYLIPPSELITGDVILYGAGKVGNDYYRQLSIYENVNIVAWVDKHPERYDYDYHRVTTLAECIGRGYDYVLIAVADKMLSDSIRGELIEAGFNADKIIWIEPQKRQMRIY